MWIGGQGRQLFQYSASLEAGGQELLDARIGLQTLYRTNRAYHPRLCEADIFRPTNRRHMTSSEELFAVEYGQWFLKMPDMAAFSEFRRRCAKLPFCFPIIAVNVHSHVIIDCLYEDCG